MEPYISETIESIINQKNIIFENEVEIIIINDGSTDKSTSVISNYIREYPDNIILVNQSNKGVSSARNKGLGLARGEFINFLDADDKWYKTTLYEVKKFFEKNPGINIISFPIYFFEGKEESHILNNKFNKNNIIDINRNIYDIQMSISSTFIKKKILNKKKFKEKIRYAEDALLINELILEEGCYGVVDSSKYLYRYRQSNNSAMQSSYYKQEWFNESIDEFLLPIIHLSNNKYKKILPYVQSLILYDTIWKLMIRRRALGVMNSEEWVNYLKKVHFILKDVSIKSIYKQKYIKGRYKVLMMLIKYNSSIYLYRWLTNMIWGKR